MDVCWYLRKARSPGMARSPVTALRLSLRDARVGQSLSEVSPLPPARAESAVAELRSRVGRRGGDRAPRAQVIGCVLEAANEGMVPRRRGSGQTRAEVPVPPGWGRPLLIRLAAAPFLRRVATTGVVLMCPRNL